MCVCVEWRTCVTVSRGYLAGERVLFKCERAPSFVGQLNSRSKMSGEGWKMMEGEMVETQPQLLFPSPTYLL